MNPFKTIWSRLRSLGQTKEVKQDIDEELRFHIEQRTAENVTKGMSPEDAAREARRRFGNVQSVREECRDVRGASFGETTWRDIRFGLRMLRKNPGFTAVAVLTLALGIGANTAVFSVAKAVLFRPLGFDVPDRLMWLRLANTQVFGRPLPAAERPSLSGTFVGFDYFQAMNIPLVAGRYFHPAELRDDDFPRVAILNEAAITKLFPGETALGKRIAFGNSPKRYYEVIGVVKDTRDVRLEERAEPRFYLNFAFGGAQFVVRSTVPTRAMIPLLRDTLKQFGNRVIVHEIRPMTEIISATVAERRFLMAMLVAYAVVALGIAAVGIFGVVACQVAQRTNEFGVRLALGASPGGLLHLVLLQAGRLVLTGLAIGLAFSFATNRLLASQLFGLSPYDPFLLTVVSVLLLLVALLASFLPARRAAKVDPMVALRHE